jgi:uncharacterized protein
VEILLTGSSGLVGRTLMPVLVEKGHRVTRLVRRAAQPGTNEISWNPEAGAPDPASLHSMEAVIHLAGENIGAGRWSLARKRRILDSRARDTRFLAAAIASRHEPIKVFISASAVGYYGDRGAQIMTEECGPGAGFLAEVCLAWENAAALTSPGTRLVCLRIGMILAANGGALARMLPPFRMGLGAKIGGGDQYMSWIALDDLIGIILFALDNPTLLGPVNAVAPAPARNWEFTKTLARVLNRPARFQIPAFLIRLLFGEMGQDVLLSSTRARPARLEAAGYRFRYPDLESALRHVLHGNQLPPAEPPA